MTMVAVRVRRAHLVPAFWTLFVELMFYCCSGSSPSAA